VGGGPREPEDAATDGESGRELALTHPLEGQESPKNCEADNGKLKGRKSHRRDAGYGRPFAESQDGGEGPNLTDKSRGQSAYWHCRCSDTKHAM